MRPAFSVIFLTTLIGAAQGLFLVLYAVEVVASGDGQASRDGRDFYVAGSALALGLLAAGLLASFLHLGRPERAWRAAAQWRTSWLSREVITLPAFMGAVFAYGAAHYLDSGRTVAIGAVGAVLCMTLFACTGMIYACIRFLQQWATPLTVVNYTLLGCASGCTLAAALCAGIAPALAPTVAAAALACTLLAFVTRVAALVRNARIRSKSSLQTAIGVKHPRIVQKAQGFMGGSFNTREFFHGRERSVLAAVQWLFVLCTFVMPALLLASGLGRFPAAFFTAAFVVQYSGLVAERWHFFAQADHPQNLYYQTVS